MWNVRREFQLNEGFLDIVLELITMLDEFYFEREIHRFSVPHRSFRRFLRID